MPVHVTDITASVIAGGALTQVDYADCHAECAENSEDCDTATWTTPNSNLR